MSIIKPHKGFQENFVRTNVDIVIGGGSLNSGKTFGACLSIAEWSVIPQFRGVFLRRNLGDIAAGGGMLDEFKTIYGRNINLTTSKIPRATFPSGSFIEFMHIANEAPKKLEDQWKGRQYDYIYMDEGTAYQWSTFTYLLTRNRGEAKIGSKMRITTNPERNHWIRVLIDWYIGEDGYVIPERSGVVRYMYLNGDNPEDVVMRGTKREVYEECKTAIDKKLYDLNKNAKDEKDRFTYENLIKSFTFYLGLMSENTSSVGNNKDYAGNVAFSGASESSKLQDGNWNYTAPNENQALTIVDMHNMFNSIPAVNNQKWITADLADFGSDNTIIGVWNGFHLYKVIIRGTTTPRENAVLLEDIALQEGIGHAHIIYDEIKAAYMRDYLPNAIGHHSGKKPNGLYAAQYMDRKTEFYKRLIFMIKNSLLTVSDEVRKQIYEHKLAKHNRTIECEIYEEGVVIEFDVTSTGKIRILPKKEMNQKLGGKRSMDIFDMMAMRMLPVVGVEHYTELQVGIKTDEEMHQEVYGDNDFMFGTT